MIIFSAHRKQIRDFVTYTTSFLFIALHFGFAGRLLAQSIDDGAPVITSQPTLPLCMPLQIVIVKGLKDQTVYEGDQIDLSVFVCDGGGTSGGVYWWKKNGVLIPGGFNVTIQKAVIADSGEYSFGGSFTIFQGKPFTFQIGPTTAKVKVLPSAPQFR